MFSSRIQKRCAGLINGSLLLQSRVCCCSLSSGICKGGSEQSKEKTAHDGKSRSKPTKNKEKRKKIEGTGEKKSSETRSMSDVCVEEENNAIPPLSFPFDGSNYNEMDDDASINQSYLADNLLVERMDNYRSEGRFYRILSAGASVLFPSVTTILSNTPSRLQYYRLRNWEKNMIKQHGKEQFKNIQQLTKDVGTLFHRELEKKLCKLQLPNSFSIKPHLPDTETVPSDGSSESRPKAYEKQISEYIKSVECVLEQVSSVLALESVVVHHELGYTGTCDCIAKYRDEVCLIDWKTSEKEKPSLDDCYDFPLQAVAYAGAINHDDRYPFKVFNALIVVAYASGAPAHAHFLSYKECKFYWSKWLHRLHEYQTRFANDHSIII